MRLMTIGACHQSGVRHCRAGCLYRMAGLPQKLGTLLLVALETDLRLGFQRQNSIIGFVDNMAVNTSHALDVMCASRPVKAGVFGMTAEANCIFVFCRRIAAEGHRWQQAGTVSLFFHVLLGGAVAGFTVVIAGAKRRVGVGTGSHGGEENFVRRLFLALLVAGHALLHALGIFSGHRGVFISSRERRNRDGEIQHHRHQSGACGENAILFWLLAHVPTHCVIYFALERPEIVKNRLNICALIMHYM